MRSIRKTTVREDLMTTKRITATAVAATALAATAGAGFAGAAPAPVAQAAAARQVEGKVLSVDRAAKTFRLRDSQRGTFRIKVTRSTRYERISGFSGLRAGMQRVEASIVRSGGRWVASRVERSGGGGRHGGGHEED
jgi:hypothetical protein